MLEISKGIYKVVPVQKWYMAFQQLHCVQCDMLTWSWNMSYNNGTFNFDRPGEATELINVFHVLYFQMYNRHNNTEQLNTENASPTI